MGKLLAKRLDFSFIDMDHAIEHREGLCISDMVKQYDWTYFRKKEKKMLLELTHRKNHVIATGGGAILHQDIWPEVKQDSLVIWLKADIETICQRLAADQVSESQRPSLTGSNIQQEVATVLAERTPLYKTSCHIILNAADSVEKIVGHVLKYLGVS